MTKAVSVINLLYLILTSIQESAVS